MNIVFIESLGICEKIRTQSTGSLSASGHNIIFYNDRSEDENILIERAKDADILVISNIPLRKHFFENCPRLKMISVAFTGVDHIDLEECRKRNITVCNAAGYSTRAVAELSIGMILALYRKITEGDAMTRTGKDRQNFLGTELYGKTIGIIGMGAIGQCVADLAKAFGCHVLAYNRSPKNITNVNFVSKEELLKNSDIVTLHIPLNSGTKNFIGTSELQQMKNEAILINTARGPVVNQSALVTALKDGIIAGAALDVYNSEPPLPANSELPDTPNLLLLPHMGYATKEAFSDRLRIVIANIEMWLSGTPQNIIR